MANELNWLRSKARHIATETMVVTEDQAIDGCLAGTYQVERFAFEGTVPYRMARALSGSKLTSTDTENEVLHLGNGYRGGEGLCRYYRTTYSLAAA
jgi:hypothetical protein